METRELAEILINKLTKEELFILCQKCDDGSFEQVLYGYLLPTCMNNYPKEFNN